MGVKKKCNICITCFYPKCYSHNAYISDKLWFSYTQATCCTLGLVFICYHSIIFHFHNQSFCESSCHIFSKWWTSYLKWNLEMPFLRKQCYRSYSPPLYFPFLSVHSGLRGRSIGLSDSQDPTCPSGLSQPATHSFRGSFLQSQLRWGKH